MKGSPLKRLLILFLVMSVAMFALTACDAGDDEEGVLDDDDTMLDEDEGLGTDIGDFDTYDADDDGFVDQTEFGTFAADAGVDTGLFTTYDADADGLLAEDEFNTVMEDEGLLD